MKVTLAMDLWLVVEPTGEAVLTLPIVARPNRGAGQAFPARAFATGKVIELAEGDVIELALSTTGGPDDQAMVSAGGVGGSVVGGTRDGVRGE